MNTSSKYHVNADRQAEEMDIVRRAAENPAAFEPLYKRYFEDIFRFIDQRLDDRDMAKDLTQQTFISALQNVSRFQDRGLPFKSWLYRIAYNELQMHFRRNKNDRTLNIDDEGLDNLKDEIQEDFYAGMDEKLAQAIACLEPEQMLLIEMRFFEKRSFAEIAQILNLTETNAKVKVYRLLDKLKMILTKAA